MSETFQDVQRNAERRFRVGRFILTLVIVSAVSFYAGVRSVKLRDLVTIVRYQDGTYSVDAYDRHGDLLTTAHLSGTGTLDDTWPIPVPVEEIINVENRLDALFGKE